MSATHQSVIRELPQSVAHIEATNQFNEDPRACIEEMLITRHHPRIQEAQAAWQRGLISTGAYNALVAKHHSDILKHTFDEILSASWASNDVRETSQTVRDGWLDKWIAFSCGGDA